MGTAAWLKSKVLNVWVTKITNFFYLKTVYEVLNDVVNEMINEVNEN